MRMDLNQSTLELQYTPSKFSKRFTDRDDLINHYIAFSQKGEKFNQGIYVK